MTDDVHFEMLREIVFMSDHKLSESLTLELNDGSINEGGECVNHKGKPLSYATRPIFHLGLRSPPC